MTCAPGYIRKPMLDKVYTRLCTGKGNDWKERDRLKKTNRVECKFSHNKYAEGYITTHMMTQHSKHFVKQCETTSTGKNEQLYQVNMPVKGQKVNCLVPDAQAHQILA